MFENKETLVNSHNKYFINLTKISKELVQSLRLLLDGIQTHIRAHKLVSTVSNSKSLVNTLSTNCIFGNNDLLNA